MSKARWYSPDGVQRLKLTGEVFTPDYMSEKMLDMILKIDNKLIYGTFLDPSCGNGNILLRVLDYKIQNGIDAISALKTLYGIDIMEDNILQCKERLATYASTYCDINTCYTILNSSESAYPRLVVHDTLSWDVDNWRPKTV